MSMMPQAGPLNASETERLLTIGGGAMLALIAFKRAPLALGALALGGALIYKGATGSWPLAQSLGLLSGQAPAELKIAPKEAQVDATVEESFPASDPPGWHTGSSFTQVSE